MWISYDPEADVLFIRLKDTPPVESEELKNGLIVDYDEHNEIVSVELLDFSKRMLKGVEIDLEVSERR